VTVTAPTRVLLIQAPLGRVEPPVVPVGLAWLAAGLPADVQVEIVDPNVHGPDAVAARIQALDPHLVGVSLRNIDTTQILDAYSFYAHFPPFIRQLRALVGPDVPLVVGGPGFSLFADAVMADVPELDFGVYLEGEQTFGRLLRSLDRPQDVPGVYHRAGGELRFTGPGPRTLLDGLRPRLDLVDVPLYRPYAKNYAIGIQTKRGCVLACSYCTYVVLSGASVRCRDPSQVVDEVAFYVDEHGVDQLFFADAVFNLPPDHARAICRALVKRQVQVRWRAYHNERTLDRDYLALAVEAGCTEFTFSPDAWSSQSLRKLQKNIRTEDIQRSLELVASVPGANANYNFFLGIPGQDLGEIARILGFYVQARRALGTRLRGFRFGYVRVEPKTPMWEEMVAKGALSADDPLLPRTPDASLRFFHQSTGKRATDLACSLSQLHRWPLGRRPVAQAGDERLPMRDLARRVLRVGNA